MQNTLSAVSGLVRGLASLVIAVVVGGAAWIGYSTFHDRFELDRALKDKTAELAAKGEEIARLEDDLRAKNQRIDELDLALRLLKVDHRLAELTVVKQERPKPGARLTTSVSFVEVDDAGHPLEAAKRFDIEGDVVYIDAWVIKFEDPRVEQNEPLRNTSICLFRRIFGEFQEPTEGFAIDPLGARPTAYSRGAEPSDFERQLWANFWDYANDPAKAQAAGVRAAHGEAPSIKLQAGKRYKVLLRASGGLSIVPADGPADKTL